jgi:hypothetical protein
MNKSKNTIIFVYGIIICTYNGTILPSHKPSVNKPEEGLSSGRKFKLLGEIDFKFKKNRACQPVS